MSLLGRCVTQSAEVNGKVDCSFTWGPIQENETTD